MKIFYYYKWIKTKDILNIYEIDRLELKKIIEEIQKTNQVMDIEELIE